MEERFYIVQNSIKRSGVKIFLKTFYPDRRWWTTDLKEAEFYSTKNEAERVIKIRNYMFNYCKVVSEIEALKIVESNNRVLGIDEVLEVVNDEGVSLLEEMIYFSV